MKIKVKYGGAVRCDDVLVDDEGDFKDECGEKFLSYSLPSFTRDQAKDVGWRVRVPAKLVRWRGAPPCGPGKKVDICPTHVHLIMTDEEYKKQKADAKAARKAEREALKKANAKAKRERKAAAKAAAKVAAEAKAAKKSKPKKKSKKAAPAGEAAPF